MNAQTDFTSPVQLTDAAVARVRHLIEQKENADLKLRIFVTGGGCSGFQYSFTFDAAQNPDDTLVTQNNVALLIDAISFQYLVGARIDFIDSLEGARFVIENPNATTTCGCGQSFSV